MHRISRAQPTSFRLSCSPEHDLSLALKYLSVSLSVCLSRLSLSSHTEGRSLKLVVWASRNAYVNARDHNATAALSLHLPPPLAFPPCLPPLGITQTVQQCSDVTCAPSPLGRGELYVIPNTTMVPMFRHRVYKVPVVVVNTRNTCPV